LQGTVVSDKNEKTVIVTVRSSGRHRLYRKIIRRVKRFMAHDEKHNAHTGDIVRIVESPPRSRKKRWEVIEVLYRADLPDVAPESIDLDLLGEVKTEEEPTEDAPAPAEAEAAAPAAVAAAPVEEPAEPPAVEEAAPEVAEAPPEPSAETEAVAAEEAPVEAEPAAETTVEAEAEATDQEAGAETEASENEELESEEK
jgi:small subunit ribosomal protein S17